MMTEKKVESKAEAHVDNPPTDDGNAQKDGSPADKEAHVADDDTIQKTIQDAFTRQRLSREESPNETIPGGVYLAADGKTLTNCWNQRIDKNGKVLDENPLLHGEW